MPLSLTIIAIYFLFFSSGKGNFADASKFSNVISITGLRSAWSQLPCLIVLDINMPVLNGKQFLDIISKDKKFAHIPIVVLTTSANNEDENFCRKYNVEMLTKPFKMKLLFETVKKILSHCHPPGS